MHDGMPYIIIMEYYNYSLLDMTQPSVVCLTSIRSTGVRIAGVRRRSRETRQRRASLLVYVVIITLGYQATMSQFYEMLQDMQDNRILITHLACYGIISLVMHVISHKC